jgi:MFS family permease
MTNWISAFMESALKIPKVVGDILGLAVFALLLGFGRTLYAKYGKNISNILLAGMIGGAACYLIAGLAPNVILSMLACILTGLCTSMLWPGTLILMEEKFVNPGVAAYALMAAGGDFGASVAPQMLGAVVDAVSASDWAAELGVTFSMTAEQIGMKVGMLLGSIFPLLGIGLLFIIKRYFAKRKPQ